MNERRMIIGTCLALALPVTGCMAGGGDPDSDSPVASTHQALEEYEFCLEGIDSDTSRGPFRYDTERSGRVNLYVPQVERGCRVPVVHFANGTTATCSMYGEVLRSLASHGFLAACYESSNTGAGDQGIEAIQRARREHADIVSDKIGSMGHSQGGQAAFVVLSYAEDEWGENSGFTYAGLAIQPASGFGDQPRRRWSSVYADIDSPMFMFSGTADILVSESWVQRGFNALSRDVEAYNWSARGATHIPVPNGETVEIAIPWFRWKLLGDTDACEEFYSLRGSRDWSVEDEQNAVQCNGSGGGGGDDDDDDGFGWGDWDWWWFNREVGG